MTKKYLPSFVMKDGNRFIFQYNDWVQDRPEDVSKYREIGGGPVIEALLRKAGVREGDAYEVEQDEAGTVHLPFGGLAPEDASWPLCDMVLIGGPSYEELRPRYEEPRAEENASPTSREQEAA